MRYVIIPFVWLWCFFFGASVRSLNWFMKTPRWERIQTEVETSLHNGRYKQRVRDGRGLKIKAPRWLDYQIDEWLAPSGPGWEMRVHTNKGIIVLRKDEVG